MCQGIAHIGGPEVERRKDGREGESVIHLQSLSPEHSGVREVCVDLFRGICPHLPFRIAGRRYHVVDEQSLC